MSTYFNNYKLDKKFIANTPLTPRDSSKLLVIDRKTKELSHHKFSDIGKYLSSNDVLVFNNTKVINARILGDIHTPAGIAKAELFLLNPISANKWEALCRPGKKFSRGCIFKASNNTDKLEAKIIKKNTDGSVIVEFSGLNEKKIAASIEKIGNIPLPPYIKNSKSTPEQYQTVYAKHKGSVAAPTAGLHFTKELLKKLSDKGIKFEYVTLHVGRGTFEPIKVDNIKEHKMHSEFGSINDATAKRLNRYKKAGKRIIAVGTTSVRCLESFSENNRIIAGGKNVDLFIHPPYNFKTVNALITNFHLPKSTLLLLVGALAGTKLLEKSYKEAIEKNYRFYSFGDAMFIY